MKDEVLYKNRRWLNTEKDMTAFIMCRVERLNFRGGEEVVGDIKIADCSKIVNLDIEGQNKKRRNQTIKKIDTLIEELTKVRNIIEEEDS